MALKYGFFDSVDGDRKYSASDIGEYFSEADIERRFCDTRVRYAGKGNHDTEHESKCHLGLGVYKLQISPQHGGLSADYHGGRSGISSN